ncbi:MAG: sensor histidine kinase [Pyrinomonadaceae bacterium]
MNKQAKPDSAVADQQEHALEKRLRELNALSNEIVDFFYTQTYSPDSVSTAASVCAAFSDILLRHWELCCIITYLRDEDGRLRESAIHTDEHLDEMKARAVGMLFAASLERQDREVQVWADQKEDANSGEDEAALRRAMKDARLRAGVCVPIHAGGKQVGALVAITSFPAYLHAALNGIRFIAAPIVIAVGNAQRIAAMREQHQRIEQLVEELQHRTDALEEANRELQRVAHYRSLFLARMSHELRTPLTSILGFSEILLDQEKLTDAQHRFCEKIQSSGRQLQTSLNQLVDLSRLEAGHTELFVHEFSLRETLRESCAAVSRLAQKQGVEIDCVPVPNLPPIVSDEGKLRQVLYNFFAFAISRSPEGKSLAVSAETIRTGETTRFRVAIEDEGEELADMSRLFDPVDIEAPTEHATSMNELGLTIARRLVDALGGTIALEKSAAGGLKILIELPSSPVEVN